MKKVIAIVGSIRKDSYNLQLAEAAAPYLNGKVDYEVVSIRDIPLFNQDIEYPTPKAVSDLRTKVQQADAIWFFTPEYNHAIPGVLKNAIDWLSRPLSAKEPQVLNGKKAAYSGIGFGIDGTQGAQDDLIRLLSFLNMTLMNAPRLTIPNAFTQINGSRLALKDSLPFLEKQADAVVSFVSRD